MAEKKVELVFSADAKRWLAAKGYDPVFGARPLKRVIQGSVLNPLAKDLIAGKIKAGEKVTVGVKESGVGSGLSFITEQLQ